LALCARDVSDVLVRRDDFAAPPTPNQALEPTAGRREDFLLMTSTLKTEAQLALAWISSKTPASLVRFASSRSRTPAVLLCNGSGRSALSR